MIEVKFSNESVGELQGEMDVLLRGYSRHSGPATGEATSGSTASGSTASTTTEPRLTAAQKKAAEKAAAEAGRKAAAEFAATAQGISTGEERIDPAADAQDAKDEAAEKPPEPVKLTHDSVRGVLGGYVQAFGMAAAQEDGSKLIAIAKISEIPDNQAALAKAVIAIANGIEKNPYKRDLAGDGITAEKLAELKPIVAAAVAVK